MNNFQRITASREALAAFLGTIPAIETPWDDAFHRIYCSSCSAADCDDCRRPERDSPLTEIGYIKGGIDRIERKQDAQDARYIGMAERMSAVESSAKSAHHRIDRLEGREVREDG